jgi:hypothetical protein
MSDKKTQVLFQIRQMLIEAPREGAAKDEPEGARYIIITDTLAKDIIKQIEEADRSGA